MEAPGRVELPTNGLGNWGFPLHFKRIKDLPVEKGQTDAHIPLGSRQHIRGEDSKPASVGC